MGCGEPSLIQGPIVKRDCNPLNSTSLPTRANADVIEAMHRAWLDNPDGVDPTWRAFFQGFALGSNGGPPGALDGDPAVPRSSTASSSRTSTT
jgi:2-oxoglutarate dehydrogenase complex dehydrogenase (E1) component-like enzyme